MSRAAAPWARASSVAATARCGIHQRDVEGGQQARVGPAELEHAPVVGAGGGVGQVGVGVLHVVQASVVERVEDELAREPEEIEGAAAVLGNEGPGGGEVLARHDLGFLVGPVLGGGVALPQRVEGRDQVALLVGRVAGLAQLVAARIAQDGQAVAVGRLGMVPQPGRRLHNVGVGVVDDPALGVGHVFLPPSGTPLVPWCAWASIPGRRGGRTGRWPGPRPASDGPSDRRTRLGYAPRRWICATAPRMWRSARRSGTSWGSTWWASSPSWGAGAARATRPSASRCAGAGRRCWPGAAGPAWAGRSSTGAAGPP